jgi:hypothetical protein
MSSDLIDLLKQLLHKDPAKRITRGKTDIVKNHPWCKGVNWDDVLNKRMKPPHMPSLEHSNFDPEYVRPSSVR